MLPDKLKTMFGLKDESDLKMADNLWKMLDEMSTNDPGAYSKFIEKNLTQGLTDAKKDKEQKQKPYRMKPQPYIVLEMVANLQQQSLEQGEQARLKQKLDIGINKQKWSDFKKKFATRVPIVLNICHSPRVKNPTLKTTHKQVKQFHISMLKDIQNLFYSLQGPHLDPEPLVWYFCLIFPSAFLQAFQSAPQTQRILLGLAVAYFQQRLKQDRNPVMGLGGSGGLGKGTAPAMYGKNLYYLVEKESIRVRDKCKFLWGKGNEKVGDFLLQVDVDVKERTVESKTNPSAKKQQQATVTATRQKPKPPEILLRPSPQPQSQLPLPSLTPPPTRSPLIQVLSQTETPTDEPTPTIPYQLIQNQDGYSIEFLVPQISSLQQLDLQISADAVVLSTVGEEPGRRVRVWLDRRVDEGSVRAKMRKKLGKLCVEVGYARK